MKDNERKGIVYLIIGITFGILAYWASVVINYTIDQWGLQQPISVGNFPLEVLFGFFSLVFFIAFVIEFIEIKLPEKTIIYSNNFCPYCEKEIDFNNDTEYCFKCGHKF
jgi:hypothetical protein